MLSFDTPNYNGLWSNAGQREGRLHIDHKQFSLLDNQVSQFILTYAFDKTLKERNILFPSSINIVNAYLFFSVISWIVL